MVQKTQCSLAVCVTYGDLCARRQQAQCQLCLDNLADRKVLQMKPLSSRHISSDSLFPNYPFNQCNVIWIVEWNATSIRNTNTVMMFEIRVYQQCIFCCCLLLLPHSLFALLTIYQSGILNRKTTKWIALPQCLKYWYHDCCKYIDKTLSSRIV